MTPADWQQLCEEAEGTPPWVQGMLLHAQAAAARGTPEGTYDAYTTLLLTADLLSTSELTARLRRVASLLYVND